MSQGFPGPRIPQRLRDHTHAAALLFALPVTAQVLRQKHPEMSNLLSFMMM